MLKVCNDPIDTHAEVDHKHKQMKTLCMDLCNKELSETKSCVCVSHYVCVSCLQTILYADSTKDNLEQFQTLLWRIFLDNNLFVHKQPHTHA